ncbi:LysR family transcriptional regulator [Micromonospora sp. NPDC048830]|uniref:LysR family transcriptional regulator n=1 Tax=Micromonospora sp. NPDC048830 TaxID=3364257 RepID=UPI0037154E14
MDLRHLRYFVAVCDEGTVSAAADAVHVAQPSLSRQLRQLEDELGVALFRRASGRLTPSPAGLALLPQARDLLARWDSFRTSAALHAEGRLDRLTIAAPSVTMTDIVAPFVATLGPDSPTTDVLGADGTEPAALLARGTDLVVTSTSPGPPFRALRIAELPVWAQLRRDHPLASREVLPIDSLLDSSIVLPPPATNARAVWDNAVQLAGLSFSGMIEAASSTIAQAHAAAGRGIAIASDDPRFDLVAIPLVHGDPARRLLVRLIAVWDGRHPAAAILKETAERLRDFTHLRYGAPE